MSWKSHHKAAPNLRLNVVLLLHLALTHSLTRSHSVATCCHRASRRVHYRHVDKSDSTMRCIGWYSGSDRGGHQLQARAAGSAGVGSAGTGFVVVLLRQRRHRGVCATYLLIALHRIGPWQCRPLSRRTATLIRLLDSFQIYRYQEQRRRFIGDNKPTTCYPDHCMPKR
jgi:hypothetical protein